MKHLLLFLCIVMALGAVADTQWSVPGLASETATAAGTLTTTASEVIAGDKTRRSALFRNIDTTISVYVGPTGVTSATGQLIKAGEVFRHDSTGPLYAVAASGTPAYRTLSEK